MTIRALVIDDNADNLSVLAEMLSLEGVEYTMIQYPTQVNSVIAQDTSFDVVFLDLEMPEINGYDILKSLKTDDRFNGIPIIAYTVHVSEIGNARDIGFDGFIGKPLDAEAFPNQLKRILAGKSVWVTS